MLLELERLTKDYGSQRALDGLTAEIRPGVIGLLGPNGAGKSTLIKGLLGLLELTDGRAIVCGIDARKNSREVRQVCGYMPEDDCLLPGLSGVESVAYVGELARLPPLAALRRAHEILDFVALAEERYREVQTYSTGMRQKIKLAQALIHAPRLVFLDEPTSGLDPQGRARLLRLVRSLFVKKGVSVVLSTHIMHDVETTCDSVMILGRGRLLVYDELQRLRAPVDDDVVVRVDGDRDRFAASVAATGRTVQLLGLDELRVRGAPASLSSDIFRCAAESGATVRKLLRSRASLEEIFLRAVQEE